MELIRDTMNTKEIKEVLQLMKDFEINELELEKEGLKVRLKKVLSGAIAVENYAAVAPRPAVVAETSVAASAPTAAVQADDTTLVKSPMVGTYYSAPSPDQPAYVTPGKKVKEGDVLCIIEAMKLMNEIKAEFSGTVVEVIMTNGRPVEFDQPLFKIRKG